jgi:flagellar protein FliS
MMPGMGKGFKTQRKDDEEDPMSYQKMLGQYRRLNVETAGRLDLVLMCYEKAIELLRQARNCQEECQYENKARKLQKTRDILHELQGCLDHEKGGQIARNLSALYTYLIKRILEGEVSKDPEVFDEAIRILSELKEAWREIASDQASQPERGRQTILPRTGLEQLAA